MPLDWLNTPIDANVTEMLARKRRAKAIEMLKAQLEGQAPPAQVRLQLADLLVQSGRDIEAVPILLGLADEFAADGFVTKAVAILKRVERIVPGRPDVESRLAALVHQQLAVPHTTSGVHQRMPEWGIEELAGEAPVLDEPLAVEPAGEPAEAGPEPPPPEPPPPAALPAEPLDAPPPDEAALRAEPPPMAEPPPAAEGIAAQPAAPAQETPEGGPEAPEPPAPAPSEKPRGVRGVLRRFFSSLTGEDEEAPATAEAIPAAEPAPAQPPPPLEPERVSPEEAGAQAAAEASPAPPAAAEALVEPAPLPAAGPEPRPVPEADEEMPAEQVPAGGLAARIRGVFRRFLATPAEEPSEPAPTAEGPAAAAPASDDEALFADLLGEGPAPDTLPPEEFQDRLLDLIEDVLQRPAGEAPAADQQPAPSPRKRLIATPLFASLSDAELLAVMQGLTLRTFGPGDVVVTEGEPGGSLFIVAMGSLRVSVRNPMGRNFVVGTLGEGDFFGEISSLSGRPRNATVTAAARCELLQLGSGALDQIARQHPRVREALESSYIQRASNPEAAAVRAVPLVGGEKAIDVLEAHFGQSRWDPRMRLRLADVLFKAGKEDDAVPILVALADELGRAGYPEKAVALLKKIERLQKRNVEEVSLAPLAARPAAAAPRPVSAASLPPAAAKAGGRWKTEERFGTWIVDVLREAVQPESAPDQAAAGLVSPAQAAGLRRSPLFADLDPVDMQALVAGLRLVTLDPGEIVLTEGEPGDSVFILASGSVKVFVRDREGRDWHLATLEEGSFFGEMASLTGKPRSATVIAAAPSEILELDRATLDDIAARHPRVRSVLEEFCAERTASAAAATLREGGAPAASAADGPPA